MSTRLFGTDGVRGVAGVWPLDPPTVARLGAAVVRAGGKPARIIIGRDTRESGDWIAREFARGAASAAASVTSAGVLPTPGVAYLARAMGFDLGVVLSASHNPYADNGIKIFSGRGEKFGEDSERAVERVMTDTSWNVDGAPEAAITSGQFIEPYLEYLRRLLPSAGTLAGARIGVDMANGATTTTAGPLFQRLGFEVIAVGDAPDGRNINLECGSTHPARLAGRVVSDKRPAARRTVEVRQ